jgi:hypothetical protein
LTHDAKGISQQLIAITKPCGVTRWLSIMKVIFEQIAALTPIFHRRCTSRNMMSRISVP